MRNKKNDDIKRLLEQELPYSKLTIQADLKFDEILSMLPDKQESSVKSESYAGTHYVEGGASPDSADLPAGVEYVESEIKRPNMTKRILQFAVTAAAACLVFVVLIRLTTLQVTENRPGVDGDTWSNTLSDQSLPVYHFPEDEENTDYTATITSASYQGVYLFMTVRLEFDPENVPNTEQLFTGSVLGKDSQNDITVIVGGTETVLYRDVVFQRSPTERNIFDGTVIVLVPGDVAVDNADISINTLYGTVPQTHLAFDEPEIQLTKTVTCSSAVQNDSYEFGFARNDGAYLWHAEDTGETFLCSGELSFYVDLNSITATAQAEGPFGSAELDFMGCEVVPAVDGSRPEFTLRFSPLPEGTERVIITMYDDNRLPENSSGYQVYVTGEELSHVMMAKYEVMFTEIDDKPAVGIQCLDIDLPSDYRYYAMAMKAGARYRSHVLTLAWEKLMKEATGTMLYLNMYSDVDMDLPLAAEVYMEGGLVEVLPLYRTAESEEGETGFINTGNYARVDVFDASWFLFSEWDNRFRRGYGLTIDLTKGTDVFRELYPNIEALREAGFTVILRNVETREALASTDGRAFGDRLTFHLSAIGTPTEVATKLSFREPMDFSEGFGQFYKIPTPAIPGSGSSDDQAPEPDDGERSAIEAMKQMLDKAVQDQKNASSDLN